MTQGFAMQATPGEKHLRYLDHVKINICGGDDKLLTYLLSWMARAVQEPNTPGEVAIVLRGASGTGKTVFADAFGRLFGQHYRTISDIKDITGSFSAHLRDCIVLFADEPLRSSNSRHERLLKDLITGRTLVIESKGRDAEIVNNCVHLIVASNADWIAPDSYSARRLLVLDVGKAHQGDKAYFEAIARDLESGGLSNLLHMLQTMDLSRFNIRDVPRRAVESAHGAQ